jgi:hypothetical protein
MEDKLNEVNKSNYDLGEYMKRWFNDFVDSSVKMYKDSNRNTNILAILALEFGEEIILSQKTVDIWKERTQKGTMFTVTSAMNLDDNKIVIIRKDIIEDEAENVNNE